MAPPYMMLTLAVALVVCASAAGQMEPAGAPGPASSAGGMDCMTALANAADCLSYVEAGSNLTTPEKPCCGELGTLIQTNPACLCQMLAKNNSLGIEFDVSKALKLPTICHLKTPSLSLCSLIGIPVAAPTSSSGEATSPQLSPEASLPSQSPAGGEAASGQGRLSAATFLLSFISSFLPFLCLF